MSQINGENHDHSHENQEALREGGPEKPQPVDWTAVREKIASVWGRDYWRSVAEIIETPEFLEHLSGEFPDKARPLPDEVSRRDFMKLMGASLAFAGLAGCTRQPLEKIVPYVKAPEEIIPGKPLFFATAMPFHGSAIGLLAESHMGRPTKIEGNPNHPESLGATDLFAQASILSLYDPDRSQTPKYMGRIASWDAFASALNEIVTTQRVKKGAGFRILTGAVTSPTLLAQLKALKRDFPEYQWHRYEAVHNDGPREASKNVFGEVLQPVYRLEKADIVVVFDSDFLNSGPGHVKYARDYAKRRKLRDGNTVMNRLYSVESTPTATGASADHRLSVSAKDVAAAAALLAGELGVKTSGFNSSELRAHARWIQAVAKDLKNHRGKSLILAGDDQPAAVHELVHAMNAVLGNDGQTVEYMPSLDEHPQGHVESLRGLVKDMEKGSVDLLLMLGVNPLFDAPADLGFAEAFNKVALRIHHGLYEDETAFNSHWHLPDTHYLEMWSDARGFDGTVSLIQPLIEPLFGARSAHEILAGFLGETGKEGHEILMESWKALKPVPDFNKFWRRALHDGVVEGTAFEPKKAELKKTSVNAGKLSASGGGVEIIFRPDPNIWDGRFANNAWLQELPKPITKVTWDNTVWISPKMAEKLGVGDKDGVKIELNGRTLEGPAWVLPGHPENSVTVFFGYGRTQIGKVGTGHGFDVYPLRTSAAPLFADGAKIEKLGKRYWVSSTQHHHSIEGRAHVRVNTLEDHLKNPGWVHEMAEDPAPGTSFYPPMPQSPDYAWAMAIDMNACTGCNACVVACQSENNIPVVGKREVARGRAMHWLRIDHYYSGSVDNPQNVHQPVLCMHCENAPCEPVCPVEATSHSSEGLNEMTYNRCVGTRYCSNNCPYKVRRFNFFEYSDHQTEILKFLRNPDVTVRSRGVMEKCTYCVQRINVARIQAKKEDRKIKEGDIVTACQASCAAEAIVFGNIKDPESKVSKMKQSPLNYGMLAELNTRPRTTYLAKLRNVNPEIEALEHV